jgi:hypothetical protein
MNDAVDITTADDVRRIVAERRRECADLDFKAALPPREKNRDLAKDLAAMANAGGGTIVVGISERAGRADQLRPFDLTGVAERVASIARDHVDEALPLGDVSDVVTEGDGHGVLVVRIEAGDRLPCLVDGQAWGRSGPKNVTLTRAEVGRLFAAGGPAFLEEFGVRVDRPAAVRARVDSERRQTGIDKHGRIKSTTNHKLVIANSGGETAHAVRWQFLDDDPNRLPYVIDDNRLITHLLGGQEVKFPMAVHFGTAHICEVRLSWRDDRGAEHSVDQTLSV